MAVSNEIVLPRKIKVIMIITIVFAMVIIGYIIVQNMIDSVRPLPIDNSTVVFINFMPDPSSTAPIWEQYIAYENSKALHPVLFWGGILFALSAGILYVWYFTKDSPVETEKVTDVAS